MLYLGLFSLCSMPCPVLRNFDTLLNLISEPIISVTVNCFAFP